MASPGTAANPIIIEEEETKPYNHNTGSTAANPILIEEDIIVSKNAIIVPTRRQGDNKENPLNIDEPMNGWHDYQMQKLLLVKQKINNLLDKQNSYKEKNETY